MGLENVQLGQYRLISLIGKGGMAEVWLANQLTLNREVAVKVISNQHEIGDGLNITTRFEREAQSVARLDHPAILPVIDYGTTPDHLYLAMPLLRGGSLQERIRKDTLSRPQAFEIFAQILNGLGYAHSKGIVHRDLKPANILLYDERRAVIADFGVAKTLTENVMLTQTGAAVGSPVYMAPEQFMGQADFRSDIYSMGVILFQILTGKVLYSGTSSWEIAMKHFNDPLPLPHPLIPAPLEHFLQKALHKRPEERFNSAYEMETSFRQAVNQLQPQDLQYRAPRPSGGPHPTPSGQNFYPPSSPSMQQMGGSSYPGSSASLAHAPVYSTPNPGTSSNPVYHTPTPNPMIGSGQYQTIAVNPLPPVKKRTIMPIVIGGVAALAVAVTALILIIALGGNTNSARNPTTGPGVVVTTIAGNKPSLLVAINPASGTQVSGTGLITDLGAGQIRVDLTITGLTPGSHNAHIHVGSCNQLGPVKYPLTPLQAGADGKSSSSTTVTASFSEITAGGLYLNVHNEPNTPTYNAACGDVVS